MVSLPESPAVIVTGKKVISDCARVVVVFPGKLAADPPKLSKHTPFVDPVNVQSMDAEKPGSVWLYIKLLGPSVTVTGSLYPQSLASVPSGQVIT